MKQLNFVAASDRGLVRGNNEDSAYAGPHLLLSLIHISEPTRPY